MKTSLRPCAFLFRNFLNNEAFLLCFAIFLGAPLGFGQEKPAAPQLTLEREYPEIALRGFGKVSGKLWKTGAGTVLEILCEEEATAKLTQAKYLSDLTVLPGVTQGDVSVAGKKLSGWMAKNQGMIAAVRKGNSVYIGAGINEGNLAAVLSQKPGGSPSREASTAAVDVPMWLNRFDKYGFRFYYSAWTLPPKVNNLADYDFSKEFDFAEAMDHSGLMLWANGDAQDTSEGVTNEVDWNWALKTAVSKQLPIGLNISAGTPGRGWFFNRYRDQSMQKMPQFTGTFHAMANPYFGGTGSRSWNATTATDAELGMVQGIVERAVKNPNITTILEPHGELRHGAWDIFMEYGPVADVTFQKFLQDRYTTPEALNQAWGTKFTDWNEVHVPEVASFLGWGPNAMDLSGQWRVGREKAQQEPPDYDEQGGKMYESVASEPAPKEWFDEKFDDSAWPVVTAPGNDHSNFLPKSPAVYRRSFGVDPAWLKKNSRVWLYVWDMNAAQEDIVKAVLNGKTLGETKLRRAFPHWEAYDVTDVVRAGRNQLSLRLPKGFLGYRVYLSPDAPNQYPNLGKTGNAKWADFSDWVVWSRTDSVRRGMEMIRQVDPNTQIMLMAPGGCTDQVKELALAYGGNFHETGAMAGFYGDSLPALMRGAGLPFCLEPGGPAGNLKDFKKSMGLWSIEGIQGIDYFIHLGNIFWDPEIRKWFEDNIRLYRLVGKYHVPPAEVAALYHSRADVLTDYPWGADYNTNLGSGYWEWNVRSSLREFYESDALTESSFDNGDAAKYKVVIDSNTSIMNEKQVADIERYVQNGGTFVTYVQTGRHSPVEMDTWPISRLTGYKVTKIDKINPDGSSAVSRGMRPAPDQTVFSGDWSKVKANGLTLEKVAPDAKDLMLWDDGTVAIGMRQIGKGTIIQLGSKFVGHRMRDRIEPSGGAPRQGYDMRPADAKALTQLMSQILNWRKVPPVEGKLKDFNENVILRHYLSNNGLYDVWVLWNQSTDAGLKETVLMESGVTMGWDVITGKEITFPAGEMPVILAPYQTRAFLTPRMNITGAASQWFALQRDWWRKPKAVTSEPLPKPEHRFSVDLSTDWAFKPLADAEDGTPYSGADVDDSAWERQNLGAWSLPDKKEVKRAILRKTFTVPEAWTIGDPNFYLHAWTGSTFVDEGRIWLDGKLIRDWGAGGLVESNPDGVLTPGSKHTVAVEIKGKGSLNGTRGPAWLWVWPKPSSRIDLAGEWLPSRDALNFGPAISLPGRYDAMVLKRTIDVPADKTGSNVVIRIRTTGRLVGVIVNGNYSRRFHHIIGEKFDINVTPWIKFGQPNEIELVSMNGPANGNLIEVSMDFHDKAAYP